MYQLYGRPGWGSVLVEAQLAWYGLDYNLNVVGDLFEDAAARVSLETINPLGQIPTLVTGDGEVLTESAAITLLLAEQNLENSLAPPVGDAARAAFLRWLIWFVANLYPTFTYADDPARFVDQVDAQPGFLAAVDAYALNLWNQVEGAANGPWFLGDRFTALDIYIAVMTHWRPRRPWFAAHCPKLYDIAVAADAEPRLGEVWRTNILETPE